MRDLGVDIMSVSLDGASPQTHDRLRGIPGTWQATIDALKVAKELGLKAQANTTVMRSNLNELADIFHIVRQSGAVAWEVFFLIRTGRGASLEGIQPSECEEVMNFLYDAAHYGIPVRTAEGPNFRRVVSSRQKGSCTPTGQFYEHLAAKLRKLEGESQGPPTFKLTRTGDGKGIMFVGHDGEVYPSGFLPICSGKLPEDNLSTIYRSNKLFVALRDPTNLKGRCGMCEYNDICGGSRSRAFAERGDPLEEDPACPYVPGGEISHEATTGLS
jgi:radical SAM protein with 4Fe4S-binding SPASM domain